MYKIAKENLSALFRMIAENQELYLPVKTAGQTNFKVWNEDAEVDLDTLKTVKSPKDAFFPQSENLYSVKKEGKKVIWTSKKNLLKYSIATLAFMLFICLFFVGTDLIIALMSYVKELVK